MLKHFNDGGGDDGRREVGKEGGKKETRNIRHKSSIYAGVLVMEREKFVYNIFYYIVLNRFIFSYIYQPEASRT